MCYMYMYMCSTLEPFHNQLVGGSISIKREGRHSSLMREVVYMYMWTHTHVHTSCTYELYMYTCTCTMYMHVYNIYVHGKFMYTPCMCIACSPPTELP